MNMVFRYLLILVIFLALDALWLGLVARNLYKEQLGHLMRKDINWIAALVFYLIFVVGILVFAVNPAIKADSLALAMVYGALFGFISYATYDLTNLATIKDWPLKVTLIDLAWGSFISSAVSSTGFLIIKHLSI